MIKNLLPQDTRAVELASCGAMLLVSLSLAFGGQLTAAMHHLHPPAFWSAVIGAFGLLQLVSLLLHPSSEPLRVGTALANGAWWVWLSLTSSHMQTPSDFGALALGISNLYAFLIGFLFLRKTWEN